MNCRKCASFAVINMRHHKLALCAEHYIDWFRARTEKTIERYRMFGRDDRVLVAISGGKDSLGLWDVLLSLGYQAEGLYLGLGIDGGVDYSNQSHEKIEQFVAANPGAVLHIMDIEQTYGLTIPEMAEQKRRGKPCSVCGLSKRYLMNRAAYDLGCDVLATGHNLDDEAAVLFQNTLRWSAGYLARQAPVLPSTHPKLVKKVKPFVSFYERETAAYALVRGIDYIYDECPHSVGATTLFYKNLLDQLEQHSPGSKLSFYHDFLKARERHHLFERAEENIVLAECESCGQPTTAGGICAFCRTWLNGKHDTDSTDGTEASLSGESVEISVMA